MMVESTDFPCHFIVCLITSSGSQVIETQLICSFQGSTGGNLIPATWPDLQETV